MRCNLTMFGSLRRFTEHQYRKIAIAQDPDPKPSVVGTGLSRRAEDLFVNRVFWVGQESSISVSNGRKFNGFHTCQSGCHFFNGASLVVWWRLVALPVDIDPAIHLEVARKAALLGIQRGEVPGE